MNVNDSIFDSIPDLRLKVFNAVKSLMKEQDFYINGVSQHGDGESGHLEDIIISQYRDHVYVRTVGIHGDIEVSIYTIKHHARTDGLYYPLTFADGSLDGIALHPIILFADADCPVYSSNNGKNDKVVKLKRG